MAAKIAIRFMGAEKVRGEDLGTDCKFRVSTFGPFVTTRMMERDVSSKSKRSYNEARFFQQNIHYPCFKRLQVHLANWLNMTTITDIEKAITQLLPAQFEELEHWIEEYRSRQQSPTPAEAWLKSAVGAAKPGRQPQN